MTLRQTSSQLVCRGHYAAVLRLHANETTEGQHVTEERE